MEPLSATASALTSIIGLIGQFKSGRDSVKSQDFSEFMQWLTESNHAELKSLIESNHGTTISIKAILNQQSSELSGALGKIDKALAGIVAAMSGFSELAESVAPKQSLSEQAKNILVALNGYDTGKMLVFKSLDGIRLIPLGKTAGSSGSIPTPEPRFLEDDLRQLSALGHLHKQVSQKNVSYTVTRAGHTLAIELSALPRESEIPRSS